MHHQSSDTTQAFTCPPQDQALFGGSFTAQLRELVLGSSRSDALSTIRASKFGDWIVDDAGARLELGGTKLRFNRSYDSHSSWVTGITPHGEFSLPADHKIAKQLFNRLDRRTQAFGLELRDTADGLISMLAAEALEGVVRSWKIVPKGTVGPSPMTPTPTDPLYGTRNFVQRTEAVTDLGKGFLATLCNITYFGVRTENQALNDYLEYDAAIRTATHPSHVPPPQPAGPYKEEWLIVSVHAARLDELREALGLRRDYLSNESSGIFSHNHLVKKIWLNSGLAASSRNM